MNPIFRACALALAALISQPALAVHSRDALKLRIPAPMKSSTSPDLAQAEEDLRKIPGGVGLIDAATLEKTRAVTPRDIFEFSPGVLAQSRVNEESRLSIRGSGLSRNFHLRGLNLYQDNIPINLADGAADFQDIDPLALRYIEVFRGGNALPLGSSTLGGAVNYVTPTGYDASPFTARGEMGSFGFHREMLSSGKAIENSDYFLSLSNTNSNGYRDQSRQDNLRFFSNFGQKLNDRLETRLYFTYADVNQELPGNLTKAQLQADPKQANPANVALNQQRDFKLYRIANKTTWKGDGMTVSGGVYTQQKNLYHPIFQLIDQESATYGVFGSTEFDGTIGGYRNTLTFGTQLSQGDTDSKRFVNLAGDYGALTYAAREKAKNATVYAEDRFHIRPDVTLLAGSQFLYANRDYHDRFLANGNQSAERDYYGISPKIGALWDATPHTQFFTNLSGSYEPPTLSELTQAVPGFAGFADIDAQKATTFELGSRGNYGRWDWDATAYRAWLEDELMMYEISPGVSRVLNANQTIHQGLELGLGTGIAQSLFKHDDTVKLRLAYTYSDFSFDHDPTFGDNRIPGAPEHLLHAEIRYDHPEGWYVAPNVEAVPDGYPVDMANTLYSSGYATLGLRAGMALTERTDLFLDARNLLDKRYAATADVIVVPTGANQAVFSPGDGRSVYAGVAYRF